ncbi:O-antigen ligase [Microbacterium trichothecenolyticum]|uniref:O-antigen ligase family protein n=1 Tax=Microbacterium trichothecenolyticum TaxID=69370 RepID=UPI00285BFBD9|nr:O-antigen ligase family protein [Microbacterium trichothecenolyticum]MDR7110846.1 O-antigen ligase [Microbacterium trichothecenolyticum]
MSTRTGVLPRVTGPPITDAVAWLTVYIALLLFIPSRLIFAPLASAGAPSMIFGLGSLVLWIFFRVGAARAARFDLQPIRVALGIFVLAAGISYLLAMSRPMSPDELSPGDVALLAVGSWSGTLLLAHDTIFDRRRLDELIWRLAVCGGIIGLLGIFQVLTRRLWIDLIAIPGLTASRDALSFGRDAFPRPSGTATHPIEYGAVITMLLPLALHVGFFHTHRHVVVRWLPALALAAVIPLTSSRSAYLGAVIGVAICLIGWNRERRLRIIGLGVAGLLAMAVVTPNLFRSIIELFTGLSNDPSITSRTNSFDLAFEFVEKNPLFGRGLGTFLPKYRIFDNQYLLLLVTIGLVGTAAFLALGLVAAGALLRLRSSLHDEGSRDLALAMIAAIITGFACLVMFDAFNFPMTMGTLFLLLGLAGALRRIELQKAGLEALLR